MNLIISKRYSDDSRLLTQAAKQEGWDIYRMQSSTIPNALKAQDCRVYAEGLLVEYLAAQLNLELLRPADDLLAQLPHDYLQRQVHFYRAADFKQPSTVAFIKPADQKLFPAKVYQPTESMTGLELLNPDDPILVSEVVNFTKEYRFFILNRQIQTGSIYWDQDHVPQTKMGYEGLSDPLWSEAKHFTEQICQQQLDWPASFVLDVGYLATGEWAVIEFNPTWASGIYGCSPEAVLPCLKASQVSILKEPI